MQLSKPDSFGVRMPLVPKLVCDPEQEPCRDHWRWRVWLAGKRAGTFDCHNEMMASDVRVALIKAGFNENISVTKQPRYIAARLSSRQGIVN